MAFTVAVREKGKIGGWLYIGEDLNCHDTAKHSKPLTKAEAQDAKRRLVEGAAKAGRPINCRIVRLVVR